MKESDNFSGLVDARPTLRTTLTPLLDLSAAARFDSVDELLNVHQDLSQNLRYSRDQSHLSMFVEEWLEQDPGYAGKRALVFPSGMAAIDCFFSIFCDDDCTIFMPPEQYRKTRDLAHFWSRSVKTYDGGRDLRVQLSQCTSTSKIVLAESPGNPHLRLVNVEAIGAISREFGARTFFDATFAGLGNAYQAYEYFDAVAHSATKYIGGHNDVVAGILFLEDAERERFWKRRGATCGPLDPFSCFLLARSLETYDLRLEAQLDRTRGVIDFIEKAVSEGRLRQFWYPGAGANDDQRDLATTQLIHRGAVLSFEAYRPLPSSHSLSVLAPFSMAPSFGSVRTLFEQPSVMSHYGKSEQELSMIGLEENLIRLSIGLESTGKLLTALDRLVGLVGPE